MQSIALCLEVALLLHHMSESFLRAFLGEFQFPDFGSQFQNQRFVAHESLSRVTWLELGIRLLGAGIACLSPSKASADLG